MKLDINDRAAIAIKNNTKRVKRNIISFFLYVIINVLNGDEEYVNR